MTTTQLAADMSVGTLVAAAEQLSEPDLRQFASEVLALQARRHARPLPNQEAELLLIINRRLPQEVQARYDELRATRDAETLSPDEHEALLQLTKEAESLDVARVQALATLAELRGMTLAKLLRELQIDPANREQSCGYDASEWANTHSSLSRGGETHENYNHH